MTENDDETTSEEEKPRIDRPVQATPEFFVDTVAEHEDRGDVRGGICSLRMADGGRRRFVIGTDVNELEESEYIVAALDDLIDLLESTTIGPDEFEANVPVADSDRVIEEIEDEGTVTVRFDTEGLSGLLAAYLADITADTDE
ncbi:MAG: hypothetical protein ABEJ94_07260 [Halorientalis sp.]